MEEKLTMQTKDLTEENVEKIAQLFPSCVTEAVSEDGSIKRLIDFEALKRQLSSDIVPEGKERYVLTWPGKSKSQRLAYTSTSKTLRPIRSKSVNFDTTQNIYIEGDNLDALKIIHETYLGKVNMIYIDPPYNTGNDFLYDDDFSMSEADFKEVSGDYDESGQRMIPNSGSQGHYHTNWLNMIFPRLLLARDLLSDDGAIFISIDDNEQSNLKRLCDEVFGESNFVTTFTWAAGRKNDSKLVSVSHEYILCYVKSIEYLRQNSVKWRERKQGIESIYQKYDQLRKQFGPDNASVERELNQWYKSLTSDNPILNHKHYNKVDSRGIYFAADISWPGGGGPKYEVLHPKTGKPVKIPSRGWLYAEKRLHELMDEDRIQFGVDENSVPCVKSYLKEHEFSAPYSVFYKDGRASTKRLRDLMGADVFQNPKDEEIIQSLVQFCTSGDSLIMDFFSGSASTAHAVFLQNIADKGNRHFIMVQLDEPLENLKGSSEASKKIYENAVKLLGEKPHNIAEIGMERIRRAGSSLRSSQQSLDGYSPDLGFRVFRIDSSNMNDVYYNPRAVTKDLLQLSADNIKSDRSPEDLLFQVMMELGIELSARIKTETINGKLLFDVDDGYLIACFDTDVDDTLIESIAKRQPKYAVFRDSSMKSDAVAINFSEIFKTYGPNTTTKVL